MTIPYSPSLTSPLVRFFSFPSKGDNTLHCISETTPILPRMWIASFAQKLSDKGYQKALENARSGNIRILSHAKVVQGNLRYDRKDQIR